MNGPIIRGQRVTLRPLRRSDAPNYCRWLANPEVTRLLRRHENPPTRREELRYLADQRRRRDTVYWAMDTADGVHIGSTSLMNVDREQRHAEFGIFIGVPRYWGHGLGTEAGRRVLHHAFLRLKLHRVYLHVYAYNVRAQRSYRRLGFRVEGRLRHQLFRDGAYHDIMVMGMLRPEFSPTGNEKRKAQHAKPQRKT